MDTLLAVPNVSEGRDREKIEAVREAFSPPAVELLDQHGDADHNRSVFTIAGSGSALIEALLAGAARAGELIDMSAHSGAHPCVGALDVAPIVYPSADRRSLAADIATQLAQALGEAGLPVFLYGDLVRDSSLRERAELRRGGIRRLSARVEAGELTPDHGPGRIDPLVGATLVTARPPLGAFNVELDSGGLRLARAIAAELRESGGGPPGVRAIGIELSGGVAQVSTNIEDPISVPLGEVVERVRELAAQRDARPVAAELIGLIPAAAMDGYPDDVPVRGFDPEHHLIENRLAY